MFTEIVEGKYKVEGENWGHLGLILINFSKIFVLLCQST